MIDMLRLLPQYTADEFDSRHRLTIITAQRAKHIVQGSPHAASRFAKETTIALDEVLRGQITYLVGQEAREAMKEAKRGKEGEMERVALMTETGSGRERGVRGVIDEHLRLHRADVDREADCAWRDRQHRGL